MFTYDSVLVPYIYKQVMPVNCSFLGCSTVSNKNLGLSFHNILKDKDLLQQWIVKLRYGKTPSPYSRVCCLHFTEDDLNVPVNDCGEYF